MSHQYRAIDRGISLLEVLAVLAVIGVISLIALPNFTNMLVNYRVGTAASEVAVNLRYARNAAIKHKTSYTFALTIVADPAQRDYYTVSGGTSTPRVFYLNEKVQFKSDSKSTFTFSANGGATEGTITLVDPRGVDHYTVTVNEVGSVESKDLTR